MQFIEHIRTLCATQNIKNPQLQIGLFQFSIENLDINSLEEYKSIVHFFDASYPHLHLSPYNFPIRYKVITEDIINSKKNQKRTQQNFASKNPIDWENVIMRNLNEGNGDLNGL